MHRPRPLSGHSLLALSCALLLALPPAARASDQQRLAVLEFELAQGVKIDRTYFSDLTRGSVKKQAPQLFVMTRESTEALLQANGKTMADCTGESAVEVGRKLGADYIISGRLTQLGSNLVLTMRLFSTADGALLGDAEASGKTVDQLFGEAKAAVNKLIAPLAAPPATKRSSSATSGGSEGHYDTSAAGVVVDRVTKLMWQQPIAAEQYNWSDANAFCASVKLAGHADWRLPTKDELLSLVEKSQSPTIDPTAFPGTPTQPAELFWSSSPYVSSTGTYWVVHFGYGYSSHSFPSYSHLVRCVR